MCRSDYRLPRRRAQAGTAAAAADRPGVVASRRQRAKAALEALRPRCLGLPATGLARVTTALKGKPARSLPPEGTYRIDTRGPAGNCCNFFPWLLQFRPLIMA